MSTQLTTAQQKDLVMWRFWIHPDRLNGVEANVGDIAQLISQLADIDGVVLDDEIARNQYGIYRAPSDKEKWLRVPKSTSASAYRQFQTHRTKINKFRSDTITKFEFFVRQDVFNAHPWHDNTT